MCLLSSTAVCIYLLLTAHRFVDANTLQVDKETNVASMVESELLSKNLFGGKWNFQDDIRFAIKDLVVPGTGSGKVDLDLRLASSFDGQSTYSLDDGLKRPIIPSKQVLVSADPDESFAAVLVDVEKQNTFGFFQSGNGKNNPGASNGKIFQLSQKKGAAMQAEQSTDFKPPAWHCGADLDEFQIASVAVNDEEITHGKGGEHAPTSTLSNDRDQRRLDDAQQDIHRSHRHHGHLFDQASEVESLSSIGKSLRGSRNEIGRRALYYTDDYPKSYSYQVNLYLEIDQAFEDNHGSFQAALDYIDLLISAASAIYEKEIDTHLHVVHVQKTNRYDPAKSTTDALSIMRSTFAGSEWHSENVDLHHALLAKDLGGGIAYVGALCNSDYGFGLSANLAGTFNGLGASTVWDLTVVAHELGHNFGSHHTHSSAYSPKVDTCGNQCPGNVPDGSSTLMSYCHQCGGMSKVSYTFGGHRDDQGKWIDIDLPGSINTNPSRVTETMYQHVSSRGTCVLPTHEVPTQECGGSTCNDGDACTLDTCIDDACVSTPIVCSDNNVCTLDSCDSNAGCLYSPIEESSSFELILETDNYGAETSWELFSSDLSELVASGSGYASSSSFTIQETICTHPCFTFVIKDAWGDGMCCQYGNGGYRILVDGLEIHNGGAFGLQDTFEFCIGGSEPESDDTFEPSASPSTASPTTKPSSLPSTSPTPMPSISSSASPSQEPSSNPSSGPSQLPTKSPTVVTSSPISTLPPTKSPTSRPSRLPSTSPPTLAPTGQPTSSPGGTWADIFYNDFEAPNQWGNWVDGLPGDGDARRYGGGGVYTHSGLGSIKLRDDSGMASSVYTNDISVSQYQTLRLEFWYYARSMDNPREDYFLEFSTDGGLGWEVINSWAQSIDFDNNRWYFVAQDFDASSISTIRLRFRCDASGNGDNIFIDDVKLSGLE